MRDVAEGQYVPSSRVIDATARLRELGRSIKTEILRAALPPAEGRPGAAPQQAQSFFDWGAPEQQWQSELDPKRQQTMRSSREFALRRSLNYQSGASIDNNDAAFMAQLPQQQLAQRPEVGAEAQQRESSAKELKDMKAPAGQPAAVSENSVRQAAEKPRALAGVAGKMAKAEDREINTGPVRRRPEAASYLVLSRTAPPALSGSGIGGGRRARGCQPRR